MNVLRTLVLALVLLCPLVSAKDSTPEAPRLLAPAEGASLDMNTPVLAWKAPGASAVELWLDGRLQGSFQGGEGSFSPFPLSYGRHDWRVVGLLGSRRLESPLSSFIIAGRPVTNMPADALLLRENWRVASSLSVGKDGAALSSGQATGDAWALTSVPATALTALVRAGVYPDPYVHMNGLRIPDSSDAYNKTYDLLKYSHIPGKNPWSAPYWFVRDFELPSGTGEGRQWLNFGELNYRAEVWLNGTRLATSQELVGMERSFRLDITGVVNRHGVNHLAVAVYPVDVCGTPDVSPVTPFAHPGNNMGEDGLICLTYSKWDSIGWDWQPNIPDRDLGLTEDVYITRTGDLEMGNVYVAPRLELGVEPVADLQVEIPLENRTALASSVLLSGTVRNAAGVVSEFKLPLDMPAYGKRLVKLNPDILPSLRLRNPRLWWPSGMGNPELHTLTLSLALEDGTVLRQATTFGIRKIETFLENGVRRFSVNGRRVFLRGGNWVNDMLLSWTADRYERELELARQANLNFLRVWGPNGVPPDVFYEAADRNGILVQQDFLHDHWGTFQNRPGYSPYLNLVLEATTAIVRKLRNHPSVFLWCGGNEGVNPREDLIVGQVLPENDGGDPRPYLRSSNGDGLKGGGPYHNMPAGDYFKSSQLTGFNSEVGPSGVPEFESLQRFLSVPSVNWAQGRYPVSGEWAYHDATNQAAKGDPRRFSTYDRLLRDCYGMPAGEDAQAFKAYSVRSQFVNYESYRAAIEALNRGMWQGTTGFALWKSNAAWPSLTWQLNDWYMQAHAGFYAVRKASASLHVQMDRDTRLLRVINRAATPQTGLRLEAKLLDFKLRPLWSEERALEIPSDSSTSLGLVVPEGGGLSFLKLVLKDSSGKIVADNFYWLNRKDDFRKLASLAAPVLEVKALCAANGSLSAELRNTGASPALLVRARLVSKSSGLEALPSYWSDNYVFLLPGETTTLEVKVPASLMPADPALSLGAWNMPSLIIPFTAVP